MKSLYEYVKQRAATAQNRENTLAVTIGDVNYRYTNVELFENTWYHFTLTRENDQLNFYLDGTKIGTGLTVTTSLIDVTQGGLFVGQEQDSLGGRFDHTQCLNGNMDNLYFYNRAINADEVNAILNGGLATSIDDLVKIRSEINIYPNPITSNQKIFIENNSKRKITHITLTSLDGKILKRISLNSSADLIEFKLPSTYDSGIYYPEMKLGQNS